MKVRKAASFTLFQQLSFSREPQKTNADFFCGASGEANALKQFIYNFCCFPYDKKLASFFLQVKKDILVFLSCHISYGVTKYCLCENRNVYQFFQRYMLPNGNLCYFTILFLSPSPQGSDMVHREGSSSRLITLTELQKDINYCATILCNSPSQLTD